MNAARSLHPELHVAGSTLASQDFQLSLDGKFYKKNLSWLEKKVDIEIIIGPLLKNVTADTYDTVLGGEFDIWEVFVTSNFPKDMRCNPEIVITVCSTD